MAKSKQASVEDIKRMSVEPPVNEKENSVENPNPLSGPENIAPAQKEGVADGVEKKGITVPSDGVERTFELTGKPEVAEESKKDTPVVNIENQDGKIVAVDASPSDEHDEHITRIETLEKEVNDLRAKMRAADKRVGDLLKERDALKKQILESPAEKLRAELEVARREYELLLGNQQKPPKQIFG
jgi:hypothetical protein